MLFFELLQVAVGQRTTLSFTPSQSEWQHLYKLSEQHAVLGISYSAVKRLPREQWPDEDHLIDWIWQDQRIAEQNRLLDKRSVSVCEGLARAGFDVCLLKGQGNALMYGDMAGSRQSGDVDVWVVPHDRTEHQPKRRVIEYVQKRSPKALLRFHHIAFPVFKDTEVEIHFVPVYLNNPLLNHRLNVWYKEQRVQQMSNLVEIQGRKVAAPTVTFNALYQLLHIYKHIFEEGIGLRQMMDYYYVLKGLQDCSQKDREALAKMIRSLHLEPLAGAVMYVLHQVFGIPESWMIADIRPHEGLSLLSEIMQTGNFGIFDTRYQKERAGYAPNLHRYWRKTKRNLVMAYYFPSEGLWEPLFRLYHFFWRTLKLWKI